MRGRVILRSVLAFCLALGIGRVLFPKAPQPAPVKPVAGAAATAPALQVSTAPKVINPTDKSVPLVSRKVDRDFREVKGGILNDNVRMTHFLAKNYAEGILHQAPYQFNASVRWVPEAQEIKRGKDTLAVLGKIGTAKASLEKAGGASKVVYADTYKDTDERMTIRFDGGMEHDIILRRAPVGLDDSKSLAYTGRLEISKGLTMWDGKKQITENHVTRNDVHFKNQFGNVIFNLRSPMAYDSALTLPDGSLDTKAQATNMSAQTACAYQFEFDDSGVKLSILTPGQWLADAGRAFPVVIDPNFGPFGLADGDPPTYVGTAGSDTLIPAHAGGTPLVLVDQCPLKLDNGYGYIQMPFDFEYYGIVHNHLITNPVPLNTGVLKVHIDGFASWEQPAVYPFTPNPCQDTDNTEIPTPGYPSNGFFPYWDDLRFGTAAGAGIYWFVDGAAPLRRLVIEWYKMGYSRGSNNEIMTFNLVLYECENKIQFIIAQIGDTDRGLASIGIESPGGARGVQYDYNASLNASNFNFAGNQFQNNNGGPVNNGQNNQPITPGTSVAFEHSALGQVTVTSSNLAGCIPLTICYNTEIVVPPSTCDVGTIASKSFGFQWTFDANPPTAMLTRDTSQAFADDVCHTYRVPGIYLTQLKITDEFGATATRNFNVSVCDTPNVVISATPQGGVAPLTVDLSVFYVLTPGSLASTALAPFWTLDRLADFDPLTDTNTPSFITIATHAGDNDIQALLDRPGVYRVTATYTGKDAGGTDLTGTGTIFIFVAAPSDVIEDSLVITESQFTLDWTGKLDTQPVGALDGIPDNPENDTMFIRGYLSLPGLATSDLMGHRVRVILNGAASIFDAVFDASGNASFNDVDQNRSGQMHVSLPSGAFYCNVKRSLFTLLGTGNVNEARLLPAMFGVVIDGLFPVAPQTGTAFITYDYRSHAAQAFPGVEPLPGSAKGVYKFGGHTLNKVVVDPNGNVGRAGGWTIIQSGVFLVTQAKLKLLGNNVIADMKGLLARYGGDSLRPTETSDVVVSLGGFSETLNFTGSNGFKTSGRAPALKFSFKRPKTLGKTGVAQLAWQDRAGNFRIKTNPIPNELVGLNPALQLQILQLGLTITPDGTQQYNGATRFQLVKKSPTDFIRNPK